MKHIISIILAILTIVPLSMLSTSYVRAETLKEKVVFVRDVVPATDRAQKSRWERYIRRTTSWEIPVAA